MKCLLLMLIYIGAAGSLRAQTVKNTAKDAEDKPTSLVTGQVIDLENYDGKRLLYVILPSTPDTAITNQVERFQKRFSDKVTVIGVIAVGNKSVDSIKQGYDKLSQAGAVLSEGLKKRKEDDAPRASVLGWLTEKMKQPGELAKREEGAKYFISEDGVLYATLGKDISLDSPIAASILKTRVPRPGFMNPKN
jgi:hypothetical protein